MQRVLLVSLICLFATLLNADVIPSKTRVLLQRRTRRSEFECSLSNGELQMFREESRWVVDQSGLETLENDLQTLVNCTEANDVLLLNLTTLFRPRRTIILPWNLTISAFIDGRLTEDDTIASSRRKIQIQCPGVNEGVFLIDSRRSTLANLQFVNCTLNPIEGLEESYGIVTLQNCSDTRNQGRVNFHHVEFRNNVLNGSVAIEATFPFCSALELVDVQFRDNSCAGTCAASLASRNELRQIRVTRNRQSSGLIFAPVLFFFPANSVSSVDGLIALRNDGNILLVSSGEISVSNSRFSRNTGGIVEVGVFSGGITFISSIGRISDSEFELHSGIAGSAIFAQASSLMINRTSFLRSNATDFGGQLALTGCQEVEIVESVFSGSYAVSNGGGIYSNNTANLQIRNSTFDSNSADTGGGIFAVLGELTIQDSRFSNNSVSTDGAGFYILNGNLEILQSSFFRNQADQFGGGGFVELCSYSINDTEVAQNGALTGAGFGIYRSSGPIADSVFSSNSADRFGGGLYIGVSTFSNLRNCSFTGNSADEGGGCYQDDVFIASLISSQFQYNNASFSGGGASLGTGSYILNSTVFEENFSTEFGGGLTAHDADLNVTGCRFLRNEAEISGAGISLYSENSASFYNSSWIGNRAAEYGGGVLLGIGSQLLMESCTLRSNRANSGAGIEAEGTSLTILFSSFTRNRCQDYGSGISVTNGTGRIFNSRFSRNSAEYGGGLALTAFIGEISFCNFTHNRARSDGGAFYSSEATRLVLQNSSFLMNSANGTGGAMVILDSQISVADVLFGSNRAVSSGGGIYTTGSSVELILTDSSFQDSNSERYGGAVATSEGAVLRAGNLLIESCSAVRGGGIYFWRAVGNLAESQILNNEASEIGGGIAVIRSSLEIQDLNISMNTALGTVEREGKGGGMIIQDGSNFDFRNLTLMQNRGEFGAGIFMDDFSQGSISGFSVFNNSAFSSGGAVYLDNSNLSMNSGGFLENSAFYGGSLYSTNSNLTILNSSLINSSSTDAGGGILATGGSFVTLEDSNLESNSAVNGGGIMLSLAYFWGIRVQFLDCEARVHGGGVGLNETSSLLCSECLFRGNSAVEEGGGIRLDSPIPQLLAFQLEDSEFQSNHAAFGGGVHFRSGNGSADCSDPNSNSCTFLAMTGCLFQENHADFTGGAILANDPFAIRISCRSIQKQDRFSFFSRQDFAELTEFQDLDVACENWKESNSAESYGPMIGSYARSLSKTVLFEQNSTEIEIPENRFVLRDRPSGVPLPTILLEAVDAFNQGPALIQGNELIDAVMTSPDGLFAGTFTVLMENSKGNFTGVTGFKEPGNYDVRIDFSEESIPTLIIVVEIRRCRIGESKTVNGTFCQICLGDTYNFSPESDDSLCRPCPEDAHCDSVVIRPKPGYWHQTPCSNHLQRCLSERACDEQDREERLTELGTSIEDCDFNDEFIGNYSEALCRDGYTGPLCGSCESSFGKSRSFRCEKCYGSFANLLLVFLAALVLLGLTGFAIRSNLPTQRPVVASQLASRRTIEIPTADPTVNFQMVEMMHTGIVPKEIIHPHLRQNQQPNTSRNQNNANRELMKWKTVEVFKITVNYLQVIGIAIAVNVDWTNALILVFEATEFIGGVTSEAATRSTDCLISDDSSIPRSAIRTIVNFIVPGVVGAFFAVFWAISMIKNQHGYNYLTKRCLLSALALGYLSYIAITKTSVNILYCIEVHDSVDFEDDSTTKYWAVDTGLKCYKGPHTVLASVFGWPVLVLFSLGFPVLVAYVLIMKRSKEGIQSPWLFETAGFLYRSYNPRYIFWESLILLRKAVLAVVVVFAYPLGGNLQGILAVCVLMIALYFHIICSPFRSEFDQLNKLEGLSLLISSLTFVSGLFFNDDRTSTEVRALISVFLIFANVGIFLYFVIVFLDAGAQYLRAVLEAEEVDYDPNRGPVYVYKVYLKTRMEKHLEYLTQKLATNRQNQNARTSEV